MNWRCIALVIGVLAIAGCESVSHDPNSGTAAAVQQIVTQIKTSFDAQQVAQQGYFANLQKLLAGQQVNLQFISDRNEEARYANANNPQQNGATAMVAANLDAAAVLLPPPSAAVKDQEIKDLKLALSSSTADQTALKATNDALKVQAANLAGQTTALNAQLEASRQSLVTAGSATQAKIGELASASTTITIKAAEADQAHKQAQADAAAKARVETARWFMLAGGVLIVLGVGLTFIHVPDALGVGLSVGGALLALGWLITYLEDLLQKPWFHYVINGSIAAGALTLIWIGYRAYQHRVTVAATGTGFTNLVGAIQDAANKNPALAAQLQPFLQEWHVTGTGQTDTAVTALINKTATTLNLTNPGQVSAATGAVPAVPVVAPSTISTPAPTTPHA